MKAFLPKHFEKPSILGRLITCEEKGLLVLHLCLVRPSLEEALASLQLAAHEYKKYTNIPRAFSRYLLILTPRGMLVPFSSLSLGWLSAFCGPA
jgi:hypothetical protein